MLTLHHLNQSRSQRILWLFEELGVPYEIIRYERDPKTMLAPESLKQVHPLGKSPVVTDGEAVLAESAAIIEYIMEKYGPEEMKPESEEQKLRYRYWMHYAEGSLMTPLLLKLVFDKLETEAPLIVKPVTYAISKKIGSLFINPNLKTHFDYVESELGKFPWLVGDRFTAADIQMSFPIEAGEERVGYGNRPHLAQYLARIKARPAYQRAMLKA